MREPCALYPVVDGKASKLYTDLYTLTNKDRKLTNLLYALSLQDPIKRMFTPSDRNSQREPNTEAFVDKLNIKGILSEKGMIKSKSLALGAINKKGAKIYYDDMMTITQRVLDFNDDPSNDKIKAVIKYDNNGFYIEVDTINSDNFNFNNSLRNKINLFNLFTQHLSNSGLDTSLSDASKKILNPLNIYYAINTLKKLKGNSEFNTTTAALLADLFSADPLMARLKAQLGNDLPKALSQVSGYSYSSPVTLTSRQEKQLENMINNITSSFKKVMNSSTIDTIIENSRTSTSFTSTYMGTEGAAIKEALKDLYEVYHLDADSVSMLGKRATKLSEAANKLLQIRLAIANEKALKGVHVVWKDKLEKRQRLIERGEYLVSLTRMLEDVTKGIGNPENKLDRYYKKFKKHTDSLAAIKEISGIILEQLRLVEAYRDVVKQLAKADLLENDDVVGDEDLIDNIKDTARQLGALLDDVEENARLKQKDVVAAFLTIYWGADKELPDGTTVSVADIMESAIKDPNLFDRFIYAVNNSSDEMMNLIAEAVKRANDKRDAILRKQLKEVRGVTKDLFDSGSNTSFMFERDADGYPSKIISDYDYARFDRELEAEMERIKADPNIDKSEYDTLRKEWINKHSKSISYKYVDSEGKNQTLRMTVPIYDAPIKVKDRLTPAQYDYYKKMMNMKAEMLSKIDVANNNTLFDVIEISNDTITAMGNTGGDPVKIVNMIKNKISEALKQKEDDTEYGSILDANNLRLVPTDFKGERIDTLPLYYQHKIKDRSRVSTDFSKSMVAYLAMCQQYIQMNSILDSLMLAKDYMLTQRKVPETSGNSTLADIQRLGKKAYVGVASNMGVATDLKGLADDFFERAVFGRARKDEGYLWGTKVKLDKAVDILTNYTSVVGLSTNILGSGANVLMGKLQMLIEAGIGFGGEFFNMKDMCFADFEYFHLLPELLVEVGNTTKSSKLGLLMQEFDVLDDFYDKIKETGFYNNPISKIIGNTNLFMLYGLGEHLLHGQGMLAVLHNKSNYVLNDKNEEVPLLEAFDVSKDPNGGGELVIKAGYKQKNGDPIDDEFLNKIKGRIKYVNHSLHGAYDSFSKGMIHRYAVGRLIMNFRQWMPAHYSRRFRGLYYDTDLGEYREGYYVSTFKFLKGCVDDLRRNKFQIATRWRELNDMQRYNLRRALAEVTILAILSATIALLGDYKDKKGNFAYRLLLYQLRRLQMETFASSPVEPVHFIKSAVKILNSPAAALNTIEDVADLLRLTDLFVTIEEGRNKGENKYVHNMEKKLPFYGKLKVFFELEDNDDAFKLFNY